MNDVCGVYGIWCSADEKWYVGQSQRVMSFRWIQHWDGLVTGSGQNALLQAAWDKHGPGSFSWVLLESCAASELRRVEAKYIKELGAAAPSGYNIAAAREDVHAVSPGSLTRISTHVPGYQRNAVIAYGAAHGVGMAEALRRILDDWLARSCGGPKTQQTKPKET